MTGLIGKVLLALAFLAVTAEAYVHILPDGPRSLLVPAAELWAILAPDSLRAATDWMFANLPPWIWDPILAGVLGVPAWLLLGLPGVLLVWLGRRPSEGEALADLQAESVFLYDELTEAARREERNPTLLDDEMFEVDDSTQPEEEKKHG